LKKTGVLNHRLSAAIATMGHGDMLVVADAGLPIPPGVERIDLAVRAGLPDVIEVTEAIAGELQVERIILASELESGNRPLSDRFAGLFPGAARAVVPHDEFKRLTAGARAVVRTGECTPYANVILVSGVSF
jgi:D-ribose pyranase